MVIPRLHHGRDRPFDSGVGEDPGRQFVTVPVDLVGMSPGGAAAPGTAN
jgi:hypothetical protein